MGCAQQELQRASLRVCQGSLALKGTASKSTASKPNLTSLLMTRAARVQLVSEVPFAVTWTCRAPLEHQRYCCQEAARPLLPVPCPGLCRLSLLWPSETIPGKEQSQCPLSPVHLGFGEGVSYSSVACVHLVMNRLRPLFPIIERHGITFMEWWQLPDPSPY